LRDRLVIATKFGAGMFPGDSNGGRAGRKAIMLQIEGSLHRLGTDYIDLYWQHNWVGTPRCRRRSQPLTT
jgi:aryl-alcohol dehydrogenase-like predicted oxidoreductase